MLLLLLYPWYSSYIAESKSIPLMSSFMFYQEGPSIRTAVRVCVSESELGLEGRDMRSNKFIEYA